MKADFPEGAVRLRGPRGVDHDVPQMGELCAKATAAGDHTRLALMLRTK
ncbi:hypothetical protein ACQEVG_07170 [Streptomyces sp. CA-135486]